MTQRLQHFLAATALKFKWCLCRVFGHRVHRDRTETHERLYCLHCLQLFSLAPLSITYRRNVTRGDIERRMQAHPPTGYSFVDCNWKKRKARFVSATGQLKFVGF